MVLKLKKPLAHDYINQIVFIEAVNGDVSFEIKISKETLIEELDLDGDDSQAVIYCVTGNWSKIKDAARRKFEGRVIEDDGIFWLSGEDLR
tara:strand:- start:539 stop:811 length:273 start_codon:yes stop_codon:yes gene_type:complete